MCSNNVTLIHTVATMCSKNDLMLWGLPSQTDRQDTDGPMKCYLFMLEHEEHLKSIRPGYLIQGMSLFCITTYKHWHNLIDNNVIHSDMWFTQHLRQQHHIVWAASLWYETAGWRPVQGELSEGSTAAQHLAHHLPTKCSLPGNTQTSHYNFYYYYRLYKHKNTFVTLYKDSGIIKSVCIHASFPPLTPDTPIAAIINSLATPALWLSRLAQWWCIWLEFGRHQVEILLAHWLSWLRFSIISVSNSKGILQ
jgi:hypothetical protein